MVTLLFLIIVGIICYCKEWPYDGASYGKCFANNTCHAGPDDENVCFNGVVKQPTGEVFESYGYVCRPTSIIRDLWDMLTASRLRLFPFAG